jgi:hypothetical protein
MGSATPTIKRATGGLACGSDRVGRIDLIVRRVIIMKGHAQLSSRGCVANLAVCRSLAVRVWLPGAWMDSQRVAGNRHHIPKANWLHAHGV